MVCDLVWIVIAPLPYPSLSFLCQQMIKTSANPSKWEQNCESKCEEDNNLLLINHSIFLFSFFFWLFFWMPLSAFEPQGFILASFNFNPPDRVRRHTAEGEINLSSVRHVSRSLKRNRLFSRQASLTPMGV